jgi:hypothetical protein
LIGGEIGKLLIGYNDKSTLSNLSKHRNLESIDGTGIVSFTGFSVRGSFIFIGATRNSDCGSGGGAGRAFPVSKNKNQSGER